jgi:hypothetical protein
VYGDSRARYEVRSASGSRMEKDIFTTAPLGGYICKDEIECLDR